MPKCISSYLFRVNKVGGEKLFILLLINLTGQKKKLKIKASFWGTMFKT